MQVYVSAFLLPFNFIATSGVIGTVDYLTWHDLQSAFPVNICGNSNHTNPCSLGVSIYVIMFGTKRMLKFSC